MATNNQAESRIFEASYIASADLSAKQYHFVTIAVNGVDVSGANAIPHGIVQNDPEQYAAAEVRHLGISKLVVNTTATALAPGDPIESTADGIGIKCVTAEHYVGAWALEDSNADGEIISVLLLGVATLPT